MLLSTIAWNVPAMRLDTKVGKSIASRVERATSPTRPTGEVAGAG